jgi:hypothetical protein
MPKSLEISSRGLDFDRFIKAMVKVKAEKLSPKGKRKSKAAPKGRSTL